jgi:broad specificity phosphatase PhoE
MKKLVMIVLLIFGFLVMAIPVFSYHGEHDAVTTLFLVRHAEKAGTVWEDPGLTPEGIARADELAYILKHIKLDAIYSTPFKRTKLTILPTAKQKGLEVKLYKPNEEGFLKKVLETFPGGTVLIVGHSNTIPKLANELAGRPDYEDLDDPVYDNLFIASVPVEGEAVILRLRFGAHTPLK